MGQHGALGQAGGAAGVLQKRQVVEGGFEWFHLRCRAAGKGGAHGDGAVDAPVRHHFLHVLDDEIDDPALGHRQHVADLGGDDVFDRRGLEHLLQGGGEVFHDHDRLGAGVLQLVLQFARGVERIDVDDDHAGAQDAENGDRILQQVGHHDGHAIALGQTRQGLQEGCEVARLAVEFRVTHLRAQIGVSGKIAELRAAVLEQVLDRLVGAVVDFRRNALGIVFEPDPVDHLCLRCWVEFRLLGYRLIGESGKWIDGAVEEFPR